MSMSDLYTIIMDIKKTGSTNAKITMLKHHLMNMSFQRLICYMYNDTMHYKINKMPPRKKKVKDFDETKLMDFLKKLSEQKGASDKDKDKLCELCSIDQETYDLVSMIINKDAKAGFSAKSINKAKPDTIFIMPYMRCSKESAKKDKIVYPAVAQEKADGMFDNAILKKDSLVFRTRNGKIVYQLAHLRKAILKNCKDKKFFNKVYLGEFVVVKDGKILPRKIGNGILNSCIQNTADPKDAACVELRLWDSVPLSHFERGFSPIIYKKRRKRCKKFIKHLGLSIVKFLPEKKVKNYEEARAFYRYMRSLEKEGAILKNLNSKWKDHTSPDMIKMKNVSDADLVMVGWKHGKKGTKYEKIMGSIRCESSCGKVQVSMSGFSDKQRVLNWDEYIGKIIAMEFESIITDKSRKDIKSLYLPQFVEVREDKSTADSLKDIEETIKSTKKNKRSTEW